MKNIDLLVNNNFKGNTSLFIDYSDLLLYDSFIINNPQISFLLQKNLYTEEDCKKGYGILTLLEKKGINNVHVDFLFDFIFHKNFLKLFMKKFKYKYRSARSLQLYVGKNSISLENFFREEYSSKCNFVQGYTINKDEIIVNDNIEIGLEDMVIKTHFSAHCNLGIKSLGTIMDQDEEVIKNFKASYFQLSKNEKLGNKEKCMSCISKPIKL